MQGYSAYFKVIKKHSVTISIYFIIFAVLALIFTNSLHSQMTGTFTATKSKLAFFNHDTASPLADGLLDYLSANAQVVDIPDDTESIQDALFFGEIEYVLRIPPGFTQSFLNGESGAELQKTTAAMSAAGVNMDFLINRYFNMAELYVKQVPGITAGNLVQNVQKDLAASAQVVFNTFNEPSDTRDLSYYFQFIAYSILAILIMGITTIMMTFNETNLANRNLCSPMSPLKMNLQIVLGNATFALVVWASLCALVLLMYGKFTFNAGLVLLCANALTFAVASLSIGFLAGKFIKSHGVQAAATNVISLGMSFISGVFVGQELLGQTVLTIASFTPGYWYIKAINDIRNTVAFSAPNIRPVIYSMLIQLGFAFAFFIIALVLTKHQRTDLAN